MKTFLAHDVSAIAPVVLFKARCDDDALRRLAVEALNGSSARLAIEVRSESALVFSIDRNGAQWSRRNGAPQITR